MTSRRRFARRTDANHADIRDGLRDCGVYVQDVSALPGLGFDLIARRGEGPPIFLEVKARSGLTVSEWQARDAYGRYWQEVHSIDEALAALEEGSDSHT